MPSGILEAAVPLEEPSRVPRVPWRRRFLWGAIQGLRALEAAVPLGSPPGPQALEAAVPLGRSSRASWRPWRRRFLSGCMSQALARACDRACGQLRVHVLVGADGGSRRYASRR